MPAEYPDAIATFRTVENRPGVVYNPSDTKNFYAEDLEKVDDEIVALQTELGTNPKGSFADVAAALAHLLRQCAFFAKSTESFSLSGNGETKLTRPTEVYDLGGDYDAANSKFVAPVDGVYHFDATLYVNSGTWTAGDRMALLLKKNGAATDSNGATFRFQATSTSYFSVQMSVDIQLAEGDYVELYYNGYRTGGAIAQYSGSGNIFSGHLVK